MMDEKLERLNRIYPNSKYVHIPAYDETEWTDKEYDSSMDKKATTTKWSTTHLNYEQAQSLVEQGERIGWIVPKGLVIVDIDNKEDIRAQEYIERVLQKSGISYSYNYTSKGIHMLFKNSDKSIKSNAKMKCALNLVVDTRANETGYIVLPSNDPHRQWGVWSDSIEEIPCFLKPILKDTTPSFIGMTDGDGRNDALFKWRSRLEGTNRLSAAEIEKSIRIINENLFETALSNNELYKTVLREKKPKEEEKNHDNKFNIYAEQITNQYNIIANGKQFYIYNGIYYKVIDDIYLERLIYNEVNKNIPQAGRTEIINFLKVRCQQDYTEFNKEWYKIGVKNGVLNILTGELVPASPSDYNTVGINTNYIPDAAYSPLIDDFMKQICDGNMPKIQFLYEIVGYCLLKKNIFEKFFIFQGEGGTGKSTYTNLIQKLVGTENCSFVAWADFDKDYYLYSTMDKLVNIDDDVVDNKSLQYSGKFKSLVSGNRTSARQIYASVSNFIPFCTCIFSCNKLPTCADDTTGMYRRMILVELNHKVENPDPLFIQKVTDKDLEYLLVKAVNAIQDVYKRHSFTINESEQQLADRFKRKQSSVLEFLSEREMYKGNIVGQKVISLYAMFKTWALDNGFQKFVNSTIFKDDICRLYDVKVDMIQDELGRKQGMGFISNTPVWDSDFKPW